MTQQLPADGPWTIKPIAGADRAAALAAAKRAGQTVGEWLGEAIRAKIEAERAQQENTMPGELIPPTGRQMTVSSPPPAYRAPSFAELDQALQLAERIAHLNGRTIAPRSAVMVTVKRQMRKMIEQIASHDAGPTQT